MESNNRIFAGIDVDKIYKVGYWLYSDENADGGREGISFKGNRMYFGEDT